ncbi:MAG: ATP-dependent Clp protease adaptor ClpS [Flavobacteriia bacterium]|nr:ATP-dependent Clp protease adaptor ClpS [Flavobacteriia bacterium]
MTKVKEQIETLAVEQETELKNLIVYNDDVNTFDFVIESLIKICKHELEQAEQCTWIIHYNGKCQVKEGSFDELAPMCLSLLNRGITAEVQ